MGEVLESGHHVRRHDHALGGDDLVAHRDEGMPRAGVRAGAPER